MKKQIKWQKKTVNQKTVVDRILSFYTGNNTNWYQVAHDKAKDISTDSGLSMEKVIGVIAALSPLKAWPENLRIAEEFIKTGKSSHTIAMTKKAKEIISADHPDIPNILNGNKITSFYHNILHPNCCDHVTIDRHAISLCMNRKITNNFKFTRNQYQFFEGCFRVAADIKNVLPCQMQADTWENWRSQ